MPRYAIPIREDTLDLIQVLQGGVRPRLMKRDQYLLITTVSPTMTKNHKIKYEDTLYREDGYLKSEYDDITFV